MGPVATGMFSLAVLAAVAGAVRDEDLSLHADAVGTPNATACEEASARQTFAVVVKLMGSTEFDEAAFKSLAAEDVKIGEEGQGVEGVDKVLAVLKQSAPKAKPPSSCTTSIDETKAVLVAHLSDNVCCENTFACSGGEWKLNDIEMKGGCAAGGSECPR
mmetsp:Transcript_77517/g.240111  ORF Transcript_77517/g.240111 Transcript_77517/m.240111 type:complete len:160 (-) Transcript_77517:56-535(-)